jgi:hypothetical protein
MSFSSVGSPFRAERVLNPVTAILPAEPTINLDRNQPGFAQTLLLGILATDDVKPTACSIDDRSVHAVPLTSINPEQDAR